MIGIDLGTTNSCVAVLQGGEPEILENSEGARTTPSVVALSGDGEFLVGAVAKRQATTNPDTVTSVKRLIGRRGSEVGETGKEKKKVRLGEMELTPEEVSAKILLKLKADAESRLGCQVDEAVITVPAYFDDAQRQATKDAARIAGLDVQRIINEPTAAALAHGLKDQDETILVFDLGGGTFDVSILETGEGVFEVKATSGDNQLGGDDFDRALAIALAEDFLDQHDVDISSDAAATQRVMEASEKAKTELSSTPETTISIPFLTAKGSQPVHMETTVTRSRFEKLTEDLINRLSGPVKQALKDAGGPEIDQVIMVGGMSRMPAVQARVADLLGKEPSHGSNPDEVVAKGAAIQAGILSGKSEGVLLLDVTPLTLGIETKGGVMTPMFKRNTTVPARRTEIFSTATADQKSVEIHVLQGEGETAAFNKSLGRFELAGIPPAPLGVPQIEVTFEIDPDGLLKVTAEDLASGQANEINVIETIGMSEDEIEKLIKAHRMTSAQDRKLAGLAEAKNSADRIINDAEARLSHMDFLLDSERDLINARGFDLKDALKSEDADEINRRAESLHQAFHEASRRAYQEGPDQEEEPPSPEGPPI